jgi:hypothetical protein
MRSSAVTLEPVRLALALAHCLPDCRVELVATDGARLCIGFGDNDAVTPCVACHAVAIAMRTTPRRLGPLLGLAPGCPRVRVLEDRISDSHVGLGVFRYRGDHGWGFVFATLLDAAAARLEIERASADLLVHGSDTDRTAVEVGVWQMAHDERLDVTICFSTYALDEGDLVDEAEALALEIAGRCVIEEIVEPS